MHNDTKEKIEKINEDFKERFQLEKKNNKTMIQLMQRKIKDSKRQFKEEERYTVS